MQSRIGSTLKCISSYIFYETAMLNMVYNIYGNNETVRGIRNISSFIGQDVWSELCL